MSNKKLSGKALVVQMTREETRIGLMRLGQANPELQASLVMPTPDGAVEDGEIRNLSAMKDLLRPVLDSAAFHHVHRVVFVLCSSRVISATTTVPMKQKGKRLDQILHANMDEYFPVQTEDYLLTWENIGRSENEEFKENVIQLWAVPRLMVSRYYELAVGLGLTVVSVDYCGNAAATAAGIGFAPSGRKLSAQKKREKSLSASIRKKAKQDAEILSSDGVAVKEETGEEGSVSTMYLHVDDDCIISTFETDGQVKLQRLVQRGYSLDADLGEMAISMEYYNALPRVTAPVSKVVLSGSAVGEVLTCDAEEILGVPVSLLPCMPDPSWALVLGASRTKLDFGIPELSRDGSETKMWQFGLVFAGGAALVAVAMLFMTSSLSWSTELGSLRNTQNQLMILAQQNSGAADDYHRYESTYNTYVNDWTMLQGSVRTYNNNLSLLLDEFQTKVPTSATVTSLIVTDESMAAQVAFKELEDVAFFIQTMRDMEYATMQNPSSVSMGPYYTAAMLKTLQQQQQQTMDAAGDLLAALGGSGELDMSQLSLLLGMMGGNTGTGSEEEAPTEGGFVEAPPTEGSALGTLMTAVGINMSDMNMDDMLPILVKANGGPLKANDILRYSRLFEAVQSGDISKVDPGDLAEVLNALDASKGGSGNRFSESQLSALLALVGGGTSGGSLGGILGGLTNSGTTNSGSSGSGNSSGNSSSGSSVGNLLSGILGGSGSSVAIGNHSQLLEASGITVDQLRLNLQNLTLSEMESLQNAYGAEYDYDSDDLEKMMEETEDRPNVRKRAFREMMEHDAKNKDDDPSAVYRFILLLRDDADRKASSQILYPLIKEDIEADKGINNLVFGTSTLKDLNNYLDEFVDLVMSKKEYRIAAELLIQRDELLSGKFAAYMDVALGNVKDVNTALDMEQIMKDLTSGAVMNKPADVKKAVMSLLGSKVAKLYEAAAGASAPGLDLDSLLGGNGGQQIEPEIRYFITVVLDYDPALIMAEQQRKGLDFSIMVEGPLEVTR